ncbi:MAG: redoxin family protein [Planctomycetia bacterium]|nr:redoxin family protein [Planctomycetia bacterium]
MRRVGKLATIVVFSAVALVSSFGRSDETEAAAKIREHMQAGRLDEADKAFAEAIQEYPNATRLPALRYSLYNANHSAGRNEQALGHIEGFLEYQVSQVGKAPRGVTFALFTNELISTLKALGKGDTALAKLDALAAKAAAAAENSTSVTARADLAELRGRRIILLADSDQKDQARAEMDLMLAEAERTHNLDQDDVAAALAFAKVLAVRAELAGIAAPDSAAAAAKRHLDFLSAQAQRTPVMEVLNSYSTAVLSHISGLTYEDPDAAAKELASAKEAVKALGENSKVPAPLVANLERSLASLEGRIESAQKRALLIGKPAIALDVESWVNGDAPSAEDLKGKVVLVDFWAVWCGPCIATFPHLRKWNEEYSDKGLVIVGVTRYYQYGWNEEAKRPERAAGETVEARKEAMPPDKEREAMVKFAQHHELKHRFAVMLEKNDFYEHYAVTGIPQAVLIDRDGKVRMIKVGSGEANAKALEETIQKLIATPAGAGSE